MELHYLDNAATTAVLPAAAQAAGIAMTQVFGNPSSLHRAGQQARELLENGDGLPPQTESFVQAFANKDSLLLTQTLVPMEKWKRDALAEILAQWLELLESALTSRAGMTAVSTHGRELAKNRSAVEIYEGAQTLKKALAYTQSNVSPAAVCGWLAWTLR